MAREWLTLMTESNAVVIIVVTVLTLILLRLTYVLHRCGKPLKPTTLNPLSTLIVLGSGGHTAEMINLLLALQKDRFVPRYYVAAATDNMSLQKARTFESSSNDGNGTELAQYMQIYRSREVGQSYVTSIGTTLIAIAHALWLMIKTRPQVIICNGPGTCIPLCAIAFIFKVLGIRWSSIFYVESIARVKRLSLSGLLLYKLKIADQLYVQWPQLQSNVSIQDSCKGLDGLEECCRKRARVGSVAASSSKACREKQRRDHVNKRFLELSAILECGTTPKFDKVAILTDAIRTVKLLREEMSSLTGQNGKLKQKISKLKAEKNALRDEKRVLVLEKEKIEQKLRGLGSRISWKLHPTTAPTSYAVPCQAIGGKLMPFVNYSSVPLWQFVSQASIDTSYDHVLHPPVA